MDKGIIDNLNHLPSSEANNILVRIFRFFNQCSYYADPKPGIRFGAWALILGFIFFFVAIFLVFVPYEPIAMLSLFVFPVVMIFISVAEMIFFLFGQSKRLLKICKHWFAMKYPTFSSKKKRFLYAFYFYLILLGFNIIPITFYFVLEYSGYYTSQSFIVKIFRELILVSF